MAFVIKRFFFLLSSHIHHLIFHTFSFHLNISFFMLLSLPEALFLSSYPPLLVFMLVLLSVHLSGHSSFHHSSFLHSFWGWIQSLFTLPDHSTDSHPWNDAIKDPTEAQSVMLTHAKPPQRAESSTQCWATGKSGGEGWRWLKKLCDVCRRT